ADAGALDGVVHAVDAAQEGRLAAAGWADEGRDRTLQDIDRDVEQRLFLAIEGGDVLRLDLHPVGRDRGRGDCAGDRHGAENFVHPFHSADYQVRSSRRRRKIATAFMMMRKTSSTRMPAEVRET